MTPSQPSFFRPSLNWLLIFIPVTIWAEHARPDSHRLIFFSSCLAIIPLAGLLGQATEHIAARAGEGLGGFLNATFGNAAELIIAVVALRAGQLDVVKASLTGSIIGNVLLVLGASFLAGGLRHRIQAFNVKGAEAQAASLVVASVALIVPSAFHAVGSSATAPETVERLSLMAMRNRMDLSLGIAIGSSIQIALFVAPLLVLLSYAIASTPMDLVFTRGELIAVIFATFVLSQAVADGSSTWFKGVQLLAVYAIIGIAFYFVP